MTDLHAGATGSAAAAGSSTEDPAPGPAGATPTRSSSRVGTGFLRYALQRASGSAISLLFVLFSAFFIFRILPGDPIDTILGDEVAATPERRAALIEEYGFDQPLIVQFFDYMTGLFQGDLGTSIQYQRPVTELMAEALWPTVLLSGTALILAVALGFFLGALSGWKHGSTTDRTAVSVALVLYAAPTFWFGMMVILVFARELRWFPINGMVSPNTPDEFFPRILDIGHHLVLPALTMTAMVFATYLLVMRASILDEVGNDYLLAAKAKGLRDAMVRRRHAVPNALLPTVTLVFIGIGNVISGALFTEILFTWPGLGYLFYESLRVPDFEALQSFFIIFSAATVLANLAADILYWFIDPRARKT